MTDKQQVLKAADEQIAAFEEWFRGEGAEPLARFESAILKTFLVAQATGKFKVSSPQEGPRTSPEIGYNHYLLSRQPEE